MDRVVRISLLVAGLFVASTTLRWHISLIRAYEYFDVTHDDVPQIRVGADITLSTRLFEPGTLEVGRAETIRQCYVGTMRNPELRYTHQMSFYSPLHATLIRSIPKVGSSTLRSLSRAFGFNKTQRPLIKAFNENPGFKQIAITRDPFDRFFSSYKEIAKTRLALFNRVLDGNITLKSAKRIPQKNRRFMKLLLNMSDDERQALYHDPTPSRVAINNHMVEMFVEDMDSVFDNHLKYQMGFLWSANVTEWIMNDFDEVVDVNNLSLLADRLAREIDRDPLSMDTKVRASGTNFINKTALSDHTVQKICRFYRRDFCCLNYAMPEPCLRDEVPTGQRVMCEWVSSKRGGEFIKAVLV